MTQFHFSPKAAVGFVLLVVAFGILISVDRGSGEISRLWPFLMLCLLVGGSFAIYRRMWRARANPDELRKAEAQGLYGVLPEKLRNWLFP
jgi:hypothetical protein